MWEEKLLKQWEKNNAVVKAITLTYSEQTAAYSHAYTTCQAFAVNDNTASILQILATHLIALSAEQLHVHISKQQQHKAYCSDNKGVAIAQACVYIRVLFTKNTPFLGRSRVCGAGDREWHRAPAVVCVVRALAVCMLLPAVTARRYALLPGGDSAAALPAAAPSCFLCAGVAWNAWGWHATRDAHDLYSNDDDENVLALTWKQSKCAAVNLSLLGAITTTAL